MKTAGGVTYTYDGDGRRVQKSNGKLYWYGGGSSALDETDASGSTANATFSEYIYFDGERIARRDYQNNVFYYFTDQINSSRVIAEIPSGGSTYTLCYDGDFYPFGGEDVFTNTCPQNYKWTGKERDAETGNDDFDARYYSPVYGRFLSADWSAVPAAVPYANLTNPQTLNLYAIVRDNPESYVDLDGHLWTPGGAGQCGDPTSGCGGADQNAATNTAQKAEQDQTASASAAAPAVLSSLGSGTLEGVGIGSGIGILAVLPAAAMTMAVVSPPMEQGDPMTPGYVPAPPATAPPASTSQQGTVPTAPVQSGFSDKTKNGARENAGGRCEYCGQATVPGQKSQKGVTPPGNEGQTDHHQPRSRGGSNDASNARHACRSCNGAKSNTPPKGTQWELPSL